MTDPLIPDYSRRSLVIQPQTNRARAPFRGTLKSEQWNLKTEQIRYDLNNLRSKIESLKAELAEQLNLTKEGTDIVTSDGVHEVGILDNLLAKVATLQERIRRLEIQKGLKL